MKKFGENDINNNNKPTIPEASINSEDIWNKKVNKEFVEVKESKYSEFTIEDVDLLKVDSDLLCSKIEILEHEIEEFKNHSPESEIHNEIESVFPDEIENAKKNFNEQYKKIEEKNLLTHFKDFYEVDKNIEDVKIRELNNKIKNKSDENETDYEIEGVTADKLNQAMRDFDSLSGSLKGDFNEIESINAEMLQDVKSNLENYKSCNVTVNPIYSIDSIDNETIVESFKDFW